MDGENRAGGLTRLLPVDTVVTLPMEPTPPFEDLPVMSLSGEQPEAGLDGVFLRLEGTCRKGRAKQCIVNINIGAHDVYEVLIFCA